MGQKGMASSYVAIYPVQTLFQTVRFHKVLYISYPPPTADMFIPIPIYISVTHSATLQLQRKDYYCMKTILLPPWTPVG